MVWNITKYLNVSQQFYLGCSYACMFFLMFHISRIHECLPGSTCIVCTLSPFNFDKFLVFWKSDLS